MDAEELSGVMVEVVGDRTAKGAVLDKNEDVYFNGALASMAPDIRLRLDTYGEFTLKDVMCVVNTKYARDWVGSDVLIKIIRDLTGRDYTEFFDDYVRDTKYPDEIFDAAGPELFE